MSHGTRRNAFTTLGLIAALVVGGVVPASAEEPAEPPLLDQVVARLAAMTGDFPGVGKVAFTVIRLDTRQRASLGGDVIMKSASSTKAVWVAAALYRRDVAAVEGIARNALWASSNEAAGQAIDLAGGIDRVNRFAMDLGLADTMAYEWKFGFDRVSRYGPGPLRSNNTTTTDDLARFWELVALGWAVTGYERAPFLDWGSGPKQEVEGDRLVARLPGGVAERSAYKMGWLPAGREYVLQDDEVGPNGEQPGETIILDENSVDIGGGIIRTPDGSAYAIAVGAYDGVNWGSMVSWVEYVSCAVYSVLGAEPLDCVRSWDPPRLRERRSVPTGGFDQVVVRRGRFTVTGWASDPDVWWGPSPVVITIDGMSVASGVAMPTSLEDVLTPPFNRTVLFHGESGPHEVCVVAMNDGHGEDTSLGCRTVDLFGVPPRQVPLLAE